MLGTLGSDGEHDFGLRTSCRMSQTYQPRVKWATLWLESMVSGQDLVQVEAEPGHCPASGLSLLCLMGLLPSCSPLNARPNHAKESQIGVRCLHVECAQSNSEIFCDSVHARGLLPGLMPLSHLTANFPVSGSARTVDVFCRTVLCSIRRK